MMRRGGDRGDENPDPEAELDHRRGLERERRRRGSKVVALLAIVVLFVVFVTQNSQDVPIKLLFFDASVPLIWTMLGCAVLGGIVGFALGRPGRRLRSHRRHDRKGPERGER